VAIRGEGDVHPRREKFDLYLDLAKGLKPILEGIDGFIDNERFESSRGTGWILSHSTWRDEKSVVRWRTVAKHHDTQQRGRDEVFQDYHLRVGEIVADTAPPAGGAIIEQRLDETKIGRAQARLACADVGIAPKWFDWRFRWHWRFGCNLP
jgi:heme-degrading monooxygenase HmoA